MLFLLLVLLSDLQLYDTIYVCIANRISSIKRVACSGYVDIDNFYSLCINTCIVTCIVTAHKLVINCIAYKHYCLINSRRIPLSE